MENILRCIVFRVRALFMVLLLQLGVAMVRADLQKDTQGLLSFKQAIERDPFGLLDGWVASASNSCEWKGVSCVNGRVAALDLSNGGLVAPLPVSTLSPLEQLRELHLQGNEFYGLSTEPVLASGCNTLTLLDLSSNNLTGGFAASANVTCTTMTSLNLSHNRFEGSLGSFGIVGSKSSLTILDLAYNNFSGSLPPHLFPNCGILQWLDLSHNVLTDSIPNGVSGCGTLLHLDLSYNLLKSTLPDDIISPMPPINSNASASLTFLDLSSNKLFGRLPDTLGSTVLESLDLSANTFSGPIPPSLSSATNLQFLNLSFNGFSGPLPSFLFSLTNLRSMALANNSLTGFLPADVGDLAYLIELDLSANQLTGPIPASISNCSALSLVNLGNNYLTGGFPRNSVCAMVSLHTFIASFNNLTGNLAPEGLRDCKLLTILDLSANALTGTVPDSFCAPQLQQLQLQDNDLVGAVPAALGNCTSLTILNLSCNRLTGPLPPSLALLPGLKDLLIWDNFLSGSISPSFGSSTYLRKLILNVNAFTGSIPPSLGNITDLEWLSLSVNMLSGVIPPNLGFNTNLGILQLAYNTLSGPIPPSLGNCTKLTWLELSNNLLDGIIPVELTKQAGKVTRGTLDQETKYAFLKNLNRDCEGLAAFGGLLEYSGVRDETLFELEREKQACNSTIVYYSKSPYYFPKAGGGSLVYIDLSYNNLTGIIPPQLGVLTYLLVLSLSRNALTGPIPDSLSKLSVLTIFYLDHNMLSGPIPPSLAGLGLVNMLDLSYNNLSGTIPLTGMFSTMPASVFANNPDLCGSPLPPCKGNSSISSLGRSSSGGPGALAITFSVVGSVIVMVVFACAVACLVARRKKRREKAARDGYTDNHPFSDLSSSWNISGATEPLSINVATFEKPLRKLTFGHLLEATNGFSEKAVIGKGGFGEVFKAVLEDGHIVAIKKLTHAVGQGDREFMAEMETIGKIKHRNLVPLVGYCRVGQERLLVYEYMEGGSLDKRLHGNDTDDNASSMNDPSQSGGGGLHASLSWEMRKRIAFGTARGLCFLHHSCIPHIIHRDLKASNVLLDDALEARVSDFGMARLMSAGETHLSVSSLVGTPGYVPPEYCHGFRCTTRGDIYSFGVVLLELITGKGPIFTTSSRSERGGAGLHTFAALSESDGASSSTTSGTSMTANSCEPVMEEAGGDDQEGGCQIDLVGWVNKQLRAGRPREEMLDQTALSIGGGAIIPINKAVVEREMLQYLHIACMCVDEVPQRRPNMLEVMSLFRQLGRGQELDGF